MLQQYRQERSDSNLAAYKQGPNSFKSYCNKQYEIHNQKVLDDLVSNSNSPKSVWNRLNRIYNFRGQRPNNITKQQWKIHFESLFKDISKEEGMDETIQSEDEHDNTSYDIIEDELEDIVFNLEIINEEILKSVQALKREKKKKKKKKKKKRWDR